MTSSRNEKAPVHCLFTDDVLLFARASKTNIKAIFNALRKYEGLSRQQVNFSKSSIFFGTAVSSTKVSGFLAQTGMKKGGSSFMYLRVPLFVGSPKCSSFQPILDKIHVNFEYWKGLNLSMAVRVSLINSVVMGQLSYSFQIYRWPVTLLKNLTPSIRNFLWSGSSKIVKPVVVLWRMC
ncbi:hypothetical protein PanWU01x14_312340, partial [Parasponia andersonii]